MILLQTKLLKSIQVQVMQCLILLILGRSSSEALTTYQELGNFEREVNNPESAKVYQTEPQSLYTISNSDEFRELITLAFNSTGGNETSFSCLIPDKNDFDSLKTLVEDGSIGDWIYSLRGSGAYSYNYTYYTIEDSILLDLKLTVNY